MLMMGSIPNTRICFSALGGRDELGVAVARVHNLPIQEVIRDTIIDGPVPELGEHWVVLNEGQTNRRQYKYEGYHGSKMLLPGCARP